MMRRTRDNSNTYTHPEANKWLADLMIDIKKMVFIDANYQPFTMERLEEWSKHRDDIETCADFESSFVKRLHDPLISEHANAVMAFNGLVIDLKLMVSGHEYSPITEARIADAEKHYFEIHQCRKTRTVFY